MRLFLLAGALSAAALLGAGFDDRPLRIESVHHSLTKSALTQPVYFSDGEHAVVANRDLEPEDFTNLYVVRTPTMGKLPSLVADFGKVIDFVPHGFVIMEVDELNRVHQLSHMMHRWNKACGAVFKLQGDTEEALAPAAQPVIAVTQDVAVVRTMAAQVNTENLKKTVETLSNMGSRYHELESGQKVAQELAALYQELAQGRDDVEISTYDHGDTTGQNSLVVRIKGQVTPDEIIIMGSHIDSVNWQSGNGRGKAPGVDDNASGTATNLEIFRLLMASNVRPARTIEIHGYAAEEVGLWGSQDIAGAYKTAKKKVIAMVQIDMNLFKAAGTPDKIWFVTNDTTKDFNAQLAKLVDQYVKVPWENAYLWAGTSDHYSWKRKGFVTSFPTENPQDYNPNIHTENDDFSVGNSFTQAAAFAKLGLAYMVHFAGVAP